MIADSQQDMGDLLTLELANYGDERGEDFCSRRIDRIGKVFLMPGGINSCLIFRKELVGKCDLFLNHGTVTETIYWNYSFEIIVKEAFNRGANEIYLVTDEEDTVKDMYQNLGLNKNGVWTEIFRENIKTSKQTINDKIKRMLRGTANVSLNADKAGNLR